MISKRESNWSMFFPHTHTCRALGYFNQRLMCLKQRDFVKWDAGFPKTLYIHTPVHLICSPQVYLEYSRQSLIFMFYFLKMHVVCQSKSDYFSEYKALLSSEKCCDLHVFGLLQKIMSVTSKSLWFFHVLFTLISLTIKHNIYEVLIHSAELKS